MRVLALYARSFLRMIRHELRGPKARRVDGLVYLEFMKCVFRINRDGKVFNPERVKAIVKFIFRDFPAIMLGFEILFLPRLILCQDKLPSESSNSNEEDSEPSTSQVLPPKFTAVMVEPHMPKTTYKKQYEQLVSVYKNFEALERVENALSYVEHVQFTLYEHPKVYKTFSAMMKLLKKKKITPLLAKKLISIIFKDFPELLVGFNDFLPPQLQN